MNWSAKRLSTARDEIYAAFPDCPARLVARFLEWLLAPRSILVAAATRILDKPYGRNHLVDADADHGISYAILHTGRMTSLHWHGQRRELFAVRSGRMLLSCGDDRSILVEGELARSIPRVAHSLANAGSADLEVLELFSPYLLDDKVRVQDFYGRLTGSVTVDQ